MPTFHPACYVRKGAWLAQFRRRATAQFWDEEWLARSEDKTRHALRSHASLASHGKLFRQWLPKPGVILEAGCGTGLWVRRFLDRGYNCIGLDYAILTLQRSKRVVPDLPLLAGDVSSLPFDDGSLAAYVSFGVVEHFEAGPCLALREAVRVLRPGGVALISAPYENPYRRNIATVDEQTAQRQGLEFYQYYFAPSVFFLRVKSRRLDTGASSFALVRRAYWAA